MELRAGSRPGRPRGVADFRCWDTVRGRRGAFQSHGTIGNQREGEAAAELGNGEELCGAASEVTSLHGRGGWQPEHEHQHQHQQ